MMKIGIKLDIDFLQNRDYISLYGDRPVLSFLNSIGITAVEAPVGIETRGEVIIDYAKCCIDSGLSVSLHPYTESTEQNPGLFENITGNPCRVYFEHIVSYASTIAQLQKKPCIINIHPAAVHDTPSRKEALHQSIRFFTWIHEWCAHTAPSVVPVAELQVRPRQCEEFIRIGDRYDELDSISSQSAVMLCWDFGHCVLNAFRYGDSMEPPVRLQKKIFHIHCHDIHTEDHQPLLYGTVPWKRFLYLLHEVGFNGTIILEVPPQHFIAAGGIDSLIESAGKISRYIEELYTTT